MLASVGGMFNQFDPCDVKIPAEAVGDAENTLILTLDTGP